MQIGVNFPATHDRDPVVLYFDRAVEAVQYVGFHFVRTGAAGARSADADRIRALVAAGIRVVLIVDKPTGSTQLELAFELWETWVGNQRALLAVEPTNEINQGNPPGWQDTIWQQTSDLLALAGDIPVWGPALVTRGLDDNAVRIPAGCAGANAHFYLSGGNEGRIQGLLPLHVARVRGWYPDSPTPVITETGWPTLFVYGKQPPVDERQQWLNIETVLIGALSVSATHVAVFNLIDAQGAPGDPYARPSENPNTFGLYSADFGDVEDFHEAAKYAVEPLRDWIVNFGC
jgi:hypothetical protein